MTAFRAPQRVSALPAALASRCGRRHSQSGSTVDAECASRAPFARLADPRPGAGCRVPGAGCRVPGAGCRVPGAGCRVPGAGLAPAGVRLTSAPEDAPLAHAPRGVEGAGECAGARLALARSASGHAASVRLTLAPEGASLASWRHPAPGAALAPSGYLRWRPASAPRPANRVPAEPRPPPSPGGVPRSSLSAPPDSQAWNGRGRATCPQPPNGVDNLTQGTPAFGTFRDNRWHFGRPGHREGVEKPPKATRGASGDHVGCTSRRACDS